MASRSSRDEEAGGELRTHGSHRCGLLPALSTAIRETSVYCSICVAAIVPVRPGNAQQVLHCPSCRFFLCQKCSSVEETPFPQPKIVLRSPGHPFDAGAAVRTRPKNSAHVLGPLVHGTLVEVLCVSTSEEDGLEYCRQKFGGWLRSDDIVVLAPTENAVFNAVVRQQYQHALHGAADLLPDDVLASAIDQTISLLRTNPAYGLNLASLLLLSLQLQVTPQRGPPPSRSLELISLAVERALEELRLLTQRGGFSATALLLPTVLGRSSAVLWWMTQPASPTQAPSRRPSTIDDTVAILAAAVGSLAIAYCAVEGKTSPRLGKGEEMSALWHTVSTENHTTEGLQLFASQVTLAALYATTMLLGAAATDAQLCGALSFIAQASNRSSIIAMDIAPMWVQLATDRLGAALQHGTREHRLGVQAAWLDSDAVELSIRLTRKTDSAAVQSCRLIACLVSGYAEAASRLREITGPFLLGVLHQPRSSAPVNAALEAIAAHAARDTERSDSDDAESARRECSLSAFHGCRSVHIFATQEGPAALCECCLDHRERSWSELLPSPPWVGHHTYLACQCPRCHPGAAQPLGSDALPVEDSTPLIRDWRRRFASALLGRLRVYRHEVVNAVSRAALRLALFGYGELALEVFWCIVNTPLQALHGSYSDALLYLSRTVQLEGPLGEALQRTQGSAVTTYLTSVLAHRPRHLPITPQQKGTVPHPGSSSHADPMGLTPSPSEPSAAHPGGQANPLADFAQSSVQAELFPPLSPRRQGQSSEGTDPARVVTPPRRVRSSANHV